MAASAEGTLITRRPVAPSDTPFLEGLYASTRTAELAVLPWSEEQKSVFIRSQFTTQSIQYATNYPDASFEVVMIDGTAAGRLCVERRAALMQIIDIALLPQFRGAGVGTRLLRGLLDEATTQGATVALHVECHNPARRLYERLGFELCADDAGTGTDAVYAAMRWYPPEQSTQANTAS
jgi:ribosomal protein S18 acetylase RimI-like enzyme